MVEELKVGIQPTSLVMDKNHKMWTITDGGYEGSPYGYEAPSLYRIDAETFTVEKQFKFKMGDWPSEVQLNGTGDKLYWINKDIWSMDVDAERVPVRPFLEYSGTIYYGLTVDPVRGDVYVADAIDYQQQGIVYRYSSEGELIDEFYVGIIPGAFVGSDGQDTTPIPSHLRYQRTQDDDSDNGKGLMLERMTRILQGKVAAYMPPMPFSTTCMYLSRFRIPGISARS